MGTLYTFETYIVPTDTDEGAWIGGMQEFGTLVAAQRVAERVLHRYTDVFGVRVIDSATEVPISFLCVSCGTWQREDPESVECGACRRLV